MKRMLWKWMLYSKFTPGNLTHGAEKMDRLRVEIKRSASLVTSQMEVRHLRGKMRLGDWEHFVMDDSGLVWSLVPNELDVDLKCSLNGEAIFMTGGKKEIPVKAVVDVHKSLRKVIQEIAATFGGTAISLEPFIEVIDYKD